MSESTPLSNERFREENVMIFRRFVDKIKESEPCQTLQDFGFFLRDSLKDYTENIKSLFLNKADNEIRQRLQESCVKFAFELYLKNISLFDNQINNGNCTSLLDPKQFYNTPHPELTRLQILSKYGSCGSQDQPEEYRVFRLSQRLCG